MKTVVLGPPPMELIALIDRRRALGQDRYDEVWEGVYHVAPAPNVAHGVVGRALAVVLAPFADRAGLVGTDAFNLGSSADYRVPDGGYHRGQPHGVWIATAAVVIEIVSPDDETFAKFDFYARHAVEELLVADPSARQIRCWQRRGADYEEHDASDVLGVAVGELSARIAWPSAK